jgi:hypothetical protein
LDRHFPAHAKRGRPTADAEPGIDAAAAFLGLSRRSVIRKRDGLQPIELRDIRIIKMGKLHASA